MKPSATMPSALDGLPITEATSPKWVDVAISDLNALLADHAHCELKAASTAMSLVGRYADRPELVRDLSALAHEEMRHFERVHNLLRARNRTLSKVGPDRYVAALKKSKLKPLAGSTPLMDQLVLCAFIEARSCERFRLLASAPLPSDLAAFYAELASAESRHHELFLRHAGAESGEGTTRARVREIAAIEAELIRAMPLEPRIH